MGVEIEVKYLVADGSWREAATAGQQFLQGYIAASEDRTVRVRVAGEQAWLTLKFGQGLARGEYEYEIPVEDAKELLTHAVGTVIRKTRWQVTHDGDPWTVDEFEGDLDGLVLAELELGAVDQAFTVPAWAGEDVTHRPEYLNSTLAREGRPR